MSDPPLRLDAILNGATCKLGDGPTLRLLDQVIQSSTDVQQRIADWNRVAAELESRAEPSGHAHFRLGVLHLLNDTDETAGISHLEQAYAQDRQFSARQEPQRLAAYRLLSLLKDFLAELRNRKTWRAAQLEPKNRGILLGTLLSVYDSTVPHILDMPAWSLNPFLRILKNVKLRAFAAENYRCAQDLLEWVETGAARAFLINNEYALARSIIGLHGGVLEAILADRLQLVGQGTLGGLITQAHRQGRLVVGTRLCALATILLYFRNHCHPMKEIARTEYFIDLNVAKGLKSATDVVIAELLAKVPQAP